MSKKRKDNKNRILLTGESQRSDGRYAFKYTDNLGKVQFVYSWKLVATDKVPAGKRDDLSLREKEKDILRDLDDGIDSVGKKMTVCQLYAKHTQQRGNVVDSTKNGRERLMRLLEEDPIGHRSIDSVKSSDARAWVLRMKERGIAYKTICNDKRSLKAAFYTAIEDDCIRKNPFNFKLDDVIADDSEDKTPLTPGQQINLLNFMEYDNIYNKYRDAVIVLLETGLRVSELCGLTDKDLDFENHLINLDHQLLYNSKRGYYFADPKTDAGFRKVPMSSKAEEALKRTLAKRPTQAIAVDGCTNLVFLNAKGMPMTCGSYDSVFTGLVKKYNKHNTDQLPETTTPHTMRHTFCTDMANAGMNPKALQYIMGHSNIQMTLNYYAHATYNSAQAEFERVVQKKIYYSCTTFEDENIKSYDSLCDSLPLLKNVATA